MVPRDVPPQLES
jgi:hypothetical protein